MKEKITSSEADPPSIPVLISDASIGELVNEYVPNILNYLKTKGLSKHAEDIISDAFLALLEQREKQQIKDPRAYLFTTVLNIIKKLYKQKERIREFDLTAYKAVCNQALIEDHELIMELRDVDQQKRKRIEELMDSHLSEEEKLILKLKILKGKSYKEIKKIIPKSEVAIRQSASRSIRKLRNLF